MSAVIALLRSDFVRHSALVFGATMLGNVLNYVFNFVLSRRLGVEHYASLTALVSGLMIFSIPSTAISLIAVKYGAEYHALGDTARLRRLSTRMFAITGLVALALLGASFLLQPSIAEFLRIPNDTAISATLVVVALGIVMPSARGILQGCQDFRRLSISTALEALLKLVLAVGFVFAGRGVAGAMAGWMLGTAIVLAYTLFAVRVHFDENAPPVRLALEMRTLISTIGSVTAATAFLTLLSFMDVVLVKHYFNSRDAGLYSAANLTGKIVLFLVSFLPTVMLPKVVAKAKRGEPPFNLLFQAVGISAVISAAVLVVFGTTSMKIITVLAGSAFAPAAPYVLQYDIAMALLAILTLVVNFRIALHRFDFLFPLGAVLIGEVVAIALHHGSLWDVIHVLIVGNVAAIAAACYRLNHRTALGLEFSPEAAA